MDESKMMASLNEDELCALFSKPRKKRLRNQEKKERALKRQTSHTQKKKSNKVKKAKIVSDERIKRLQMAIARVKKEQGYKSIAEALLRVDETIVPLSFAENMFDRKLYPDSNESDLLQTHVADTGSTAGLNDVEQFLFAVSAIKRLPARLESMKIKGNFEQDLGEVKKQIAKYNKAVHQVCIYFALC